MAGLPALPLMAMEAKGPLAAIADACTFWLRMRSGSIGTRKKASAILVRDDRSLSGGVCVATLPIGSFFSRERPGGAEKMAK
jgi:hypothetical protein